MEIFFSQVVTTNRCDYVIDIDFFLALPGDLIIVVNKYDYGPIWKTEETPPLELRGRKLCCVYLVLVVVPVASLECGLLSQYLNLRSTLLHHTLPGYFRVER